METLYCSCGREMVREGRVFAEMIPGDGFGTTRIKYKVFLSCPERLKPFGWIKPGHEQKTIITDD